MAELGVVRPLRLHAMNFEYFRKTCGFHFRIRADKAAGSGVELVSIVSEYVEWKKEYETIEERIGHYESAQDAAEDLESQTTGYFDWDSEPCRSVPPDIAFLDQWQTDPPQPWN